MSFTIDPHLDEQEIKIDENDLKLKCPFSMVVSGSSQSGKSHFMYNLVKYRDCMFSNYFNRIIYCQSNLTSEKNINYVKKLKECFPNIETCQGLPKMSELNLLFNDGHKLVLLDDLMTDVLTSEHILQLATNDVHNYDLSVVIIMQNYYSSSKFGRTLVKNCQYRVFFHTNLDLYETKLISKQISTYSNFFSECYEYLKKNFPEEISYYLLVDGHMKSKMNKMWCRSLIFPRDPENQITPLVFYPNSNKK